MKFEKSVLRDFLDYQPPHLAMIRAVEAVYYRKYLPLRGKILDVGCGDGFFAWSVFRGQKIDMGIDIKGSLWKKAERRNNYKKVSQYDGKKIPARDELFETIICNCVLEHVPQVENLVREMSRVNKTGGLLLATVVGKDFGKNFFGRKILGENYLKWFNKKSRHVSCKNRKEWKELLEKEGYKIRIIEPYFNFGGAEEWFEISHYWGVVNLIYRKIWGRWVGGVAKISNKLWEKMAMGLIKNMKNKTESEPYFWVVAEKIRT